MSRNKNISKIIIDNAIASQGQNKELKDALQGMLDLYERLIPYIKDAPVMEEDVAAEQKAVNLLERLR